MTLEELEELMVWTSENFLDPKKLGVKVIEDDYPARWTDPRLIEPWIRQASADRLAEARTYLPKLLAVARAAKEIGHECRSHECPMCEALRALEGQGAGP
jgi:hypothetical protein